MQLSPLQSRLAASLLASCLLLIIYFVLCSPHFALAIEIEERTRMSIDTAALDQSPNLAARRPLEPKYEPEFSAFDRSITGRTPEGTTRLANNVAMPMNVAAGTIQNFVFTVEPIASRGFDRDQAMVQGRAGEGDGDGRRTEEGLARRDNTSTTVFISANTCERPHSADASTAARYPPQLVLYVSTDPSNPLPGPSTHATSHIQLEFTEGAVMFSVEATSVVYLGVYAPSETGWIGDYNFRLAASTDEWYQSYSVSTDADLIWVDSDSQGALLITHNLTDAADTEMEKIMGTRPYVLFAQNQEDRSIDGLKLSYCGLQNHAQIATTRNGQFASMVISGMTKRGPGNLPKQEFLFSGLNASSRYWAILARDDSASSKRDGAGGGGHVYRATEFLTKRDHGNCNLVTNLTFCDQVAYSVPSNPTRFNVSQLAKVYDDRAASIYENFQKVIAQISCDAPSSQRYSLARNCSDCRTAYKNWLCFVSIPRCDDFSSDADYLLPRAISQPFPDGKLLGAGELTSIRNTTAFNSSRNPWIDMVIRPGPYKELLPCGDLCYALVQSCPASMRFACPLPDDVRFKYSYGEWLGKENGTSDTCNFPGSSHRFSSSSRTRPLWALLCVGLAVGGFLL